MQVDGFAKSALIKGATAGATPGNWSLGFRLDRCPDEAQRLGERLKGFEGQEHNDTTWYNLLLDTWPFSYLFLLRWCSGSVSDDRCHIISGKKALEVIFLSHPDLETTGQRTARQIALALHHPAVTGRAGVLGSFNALLASSSGDIWHRGLEVLRMLRLNSLEADEVTGGEGLMKPIGRYEIFKAMCCPR